MSLRIDTTKSIEKYKIEWTYGSDEYSSGLKILKYKSQSIRSECRQCRAGMNEDSPDVKVLNVVLAVVANQENSTNVEKTEAELILNFGGINL